MEVWVVAGMLHLTALVLARSAYWTGSLSVHKQFLWKLWYYSSLNKLHRFYKRNPKALHSVTHTHTHMQTCTLQMPSSSSPPSATSKSNQKFQPPGLQALQHPPRYTLTHSYTHTGHTQKHTDWGIGHQIIRTISWKEGLKCSCQVCLRACVWGCVSMAESARTITPLSTLSFSFESKLLFRLTINCWSWLSGPAESAAAFQRKPCFTSQSWLGRQKMRFPYFHCFVDAFIIWETVQ